MDFKDIKYLFPSLPNQEVNSRNFLSRPSLRTSLMPCPLSFLQGKDQAPGLHLSPGRCLGMDEWMFLLELMMGLQASFSSPDLGRAWISFQPLLYQITTNPVTQNNTALLSYSFVDLKSNVDLSAYIKVLSGLCSFLDPRGESISLPLPASRGRSHSLAHGALLHL